MSESSRGQDWIDALLVERAGYLRIGKPERAAEVDKALEAAGYSAPRTVSPDAAPAARGRRTTKG